MFLYECNFLFKFSLGNLISLTVSNRFRDVMKHPTVALNIDLIQDGIKSINPRFNPFSTLCDEAMASIDQMTCSLMDLVNWKNEFLQQEMPPSIHMTFGVLFSRFLRS